MIVGCIEINGTSKGKPLKQYRLRWLCQFVCQKTDIARCATIRTSKLLTPSAIAVVSWLEINGTSKGFHISSYRLLVGFLYLAENRTGEAAHRCQQSVSPGNPDHTTSPKVTDGKKLNKKNVWCAKWLSRMLKKWIQIGPFWSMSNLIRLNQPVSKETGRSSKIRYKWIYS